MSIWTVFTVVLVAFAACGSLSTQRSVRVPSPICFGTTGYNWGPVVVWITHRGVWYTSGQPDTTGLCNHPPRQWANLDSPFRSVPVGIDDLFHPPKSHLGPSRQIDLATIQRLYRLASRDRFDTFPRSRGKPWDYQNRVTCEYNCWPTYDFMEFGGQTAYQGYGAGPPPNPPEWYNRFYDIFDQLVYLTPYDKLASANAEYE